MRQLVLAAAVVGTALMSGYGVAVGEIAIEVPGAGLHLGSTYHDDGYQYSYGDRYFGGYRRYDDGFRRGGRLRGDFNICGRYAYFDGDACQAGRRP